MIKVLKNFRKKIFSHLIPFLNLLVFCSGCSWLNYFLFSSESLTSSLGEETISNFQINRASVGSRPHHERFSSIESVHWHIEKAKIYQMKVCIEDRVDRNLIIGQSFEVLNEDKTYKFDTQNLETDVNGCLHWKEKIQYNYFAMSRYVRFERVIRPFGSTNHFGEIRWAFSVNLWSKGRESDPAKPINSFKNPLDFVSQDLSESNKGLVITYQTSSEPSLSTLPVVDFVKVVDDADDLPASLIIKLGTLQRSPIPISGLVGTKSKFTFNLHLNARVYDESGSFYDLPLPTGAYEASVHLVQVLESPSEASSGSSKTPHSQCVRLTSVSRSPHSTIPLTKNPLSFVLEVDFLHQLNKQSKVGIELEVKPAELPPGVRLNGVTSYYSLGANVDAVFDEKQDTVPPLVESCQSSSTLNVSDLNDLGLKRLPVRAWDILPENGAFKIKQIDVHDESAGIRKLFLAFEMCFSSDETLANNLPSSFTLNHILRAHDQRYLIRPFEGLPTDNNGADNNGAYILCPKQSDGTCNTHQVEQHCVTLQDRLRYKYYTKQNYSPLVMYRADSDRFSDYTPILFLKFNLHNIDGNAVNGIVTLENHIGNKYIQAMNFKSSRLNVTSFNEQPITFNVMDKSATSIIEALSLEIDDSLNRTNRYKVVLTTEPILSIPPHQGVEESEDKLRPGIYLLRTMLLKRDRHRFFPFRELDGASEDNTSGDEEKIAILSGGEKLIYIDDGIMNPSFHFPIKNIELTNIQQNLFVQYRLVDEKTLILLYLLSKIQKLKLSKNSADSPSMTTPLLSCFKDGECTHLNKTNWMSGKSSRGEPFLKDYERPSTSDEFSALIDLIQARDTSNITTCDSDFSKDSLFYETCESKIKTLSDFLANISAPVKVVEEKQKQRDENFHSFFNNYTSFDQASSLEKTLKSVLGVSLDGNQSHNFSLTQNYFVIDSFEQTKEKLKEFAPLQSLNKEMQNKIVLLLLKILHDSSSFLSKIQSDKTTVNIIPIINFIENFLERARTLLDSASYNKIQFALYENSDLISPVYWTPIVLSGSKVLSPQKSQFLQLSEIPLENGELSSYQTSTLCSTDKDETSSSDGGEPSSSEEGKKSEDDCSIDPDPIKSELGQEVDHYKAFKDQQPSDSYMEYLFKQEEKIKHMDTLSMCYAKIRPLLYLEMKYVSLSGSEFLDPYCQDLLLNEIVRLYKESNKTPLKLDIEEVIKMSFIDQCVLDDLSDQSTDDKIEEVFKTCLDEKILYGKENNSLSFLDQINTPAYPTKDPNAPSVSVEGWSRASTAEEKESLRDFLENGIEVARYQNLKTGGLPTFITVNKDSLVQLIQQFSLRQELMKWEWNEKKNIFLHLCLHLNHAFSLSLVESPFNSIYNNSGASVTISTITILDCLLGFFYLTTNQSESESNLEIPFTIEKHYRVFKAHKMQQKETKATDLQLWPFENLESSINIGTQLSYGYRTPPAFPLTSRSSDRVQDGINLSDRYRVFEYTRLRLEETEVTIQLTDYEECLVFHKNPEYFLKKLKLEQEKNWLEVQFDILDVLTHIQIGHHPFKGSPKDMSSVLRDFYIQKGGGFYLCHKPSESVEVTEWYFYIENARQYKSFLETVDSKNQPWSLSIRGVDPLLVLYRLILSDYYIDQISKNPDRPDRLIGQSTVSRLKQAYRTFSLIQPYLGFHPGTYMEKPDDNTSLDNTSLYFKEQVEGQEVAQEVDQKLEGVSTVIPEDQGVQ